MSRIRALVGAVGKWWFEPHPRGRVAALRTILYGFVFVDVLLTTTWVARHADVPTELYQPLFVGRLLPLPEPTEAVVTGVMVAMLVCAGIAATGRAPRLLGTAVFLLYFEWMFIAMSYGKVDHDRVAFLVALAVLPTVGRARWGDKARDEASGWAVRCIQVAVVLTYVLAVVAKLRFGGPEWLTGATLMRAVIRRGTFLADPLQDLPWVLQAAQFGIVAFELSTPLLFVRGKVGRVFLGVALVFHAVTYSTIGIIFLPHVMCLAAFVPLERIELRPFAASRDAVASPP
ncbi:MAG: HTTM domain-containing protein [Actinomycetota bacterium]